MTLQAWFKRFHNRPLKIAAAFLLAVWFVFAMRSFLSVTEKQLQTVTQAADLLSLTAQSKNRAMSESLLETLISQGGARSAALCSGAQQILSANQDLSGCEHTSVFFERLIEQKIPGSPDLLLEAKFNMLSSLSTVFWVLGLGLMLLLASFYFLRIAHRRIEKDILKPLLNRFLSDEPFEINELNELRDRFQHARKLESQKVVNLAIRDNNRQVAHDIRSPVQSVAELLQFVDITDPALKAAIGKAINRANQIAESLLDAEKSSNAETSESTYDFSSLIEDIVIEKGPLFHDGQIEIDLPQSLIARSLISRESLLRILSNLIDNSMLACKERRHIEIAMHALQESIVITVADSGAGMAADVLARLGEKGFSKRDSDAGQGYGRGVSSAKLALEEIQGSLTYESKVGEGTVAALRIPARLQPTMGKPDLVLIDNEEFIRVTWEVSASESDLSCATFSSVEEFIGVSHLIPRNVPLFIDSDLGQGRLGQSFAPQLRALGFERIYLATGYGDLADQELPSIDGVIGKHFAVALACIAGEQATAPLQCKII